MYMVAAALAAAISFAGEPAAAGKRPSSGLGIGPGMIVVSNIPLGKEVDPNVEFELHNHAAVARVLVLKAMKPQESGIAGWEKGYEPIPDAAWCRLEKEEIEVPAEGVAKVKGFINIPDKPENYNRKFMVGVICESKPPKGGKGAGINLRMVSRWGIETATKAEVDGKGAGSVALIPSVLRAEAKAGSKYEAAFKLRNNAEVARTFIGKRLADVEADSEKHLRYFGFGREPILTGTWLASLEKFTVGPGETKEVKLTVNVPKEAAVDKIHEELLFLEDDTGRLEFVRIRTGVLTGN